MAAMSIDWRGIRDALRIRRAEKRMKVNEVAKKAGVSRTTIYRVENVTDIPEYVIDLETLDALANAMDYTLADVFAAAEHRPVTTDEQREAQQIAQLWSTVPESIRTPVRALLQGNASAETKHLESLPQPAVEKATGSHRVSAQRGKR